MERHWNLSYQLCQSHWKLQMLLHSPKSGNNVVNKRTRTRSVEKLKAYQKSLQCPWRSQSHILSSTRGFRLASIGKFSQWCVNIRYLIQGIGPRCNWSCNYCNKSKRGDVGWISKGAFGILKNKFFIRLVALDFFFKLKGFSIKLFFLGDWFYVQAKWSLKWLEMFQFLSVENKFDALNSFDSDTSNFFVSIPKYFNIVMDYTFDGYCDPFTWTSGMESKSINVPWACISSDVSFIFKSK